MISIIDINISYIASLVFAELSKNKSKPNYYIFYAPYSSVTTLSSFKSFLFPIKINIAFYPTFSFTSYNQNSILLKESKLFNSLIYSINNYYYLYITIITFD